MKTTLLIIGLIIALSAEQLSAQFFGVAVVAFVMLDIHSLEDSP